MKEYTLQDAKDEVAKMDFQPLSLCHYNDTVAQLLVSKVTEELRKENEVMKGQLEFYRSETQKLREYLKVNRIGKPNQKLFDALYEEIERLNESNMKLEEWKQQSIEVMGDTLKLLIKLRK